MPRFFFDVHNVDQLYVDDVGEELEGPDAALEAALELLPELLQCGNLVTDSGLLDATVRDHTGRAILMTTLSLNYRRFDQEALNDGREPPFDPTRAITEIKVRPTEATAALIQRSRALIKSCRATSSHVRAAFERSGHLLDDTRQLMCRLEGSGPH